MWKIYKLKNLIFSIYDERFSCLGEFIPKYITPVDEFDYYVIATTPKEVHEEARQNGDIKEEYLDYIEDGFFLPAREVSKYYKAKKGDN